MLPYREHPAAECFLGIWVLRCLASAATREKQNEPVRFSWLFVVILCTPVEPVVMGWTSRLNATCRSAHAYGSPLAAAAAHRLWGLSFVNCCGGSQDPTVRDTLISVRLCPRANVTFLPRLRLCCKSPFCHRSLHSSIWKNVQCLKMSSCVYFHSQKELIKLY